MSQGGVEGVFEAGCLILGGHGVLKTIMKGLRFLLGLPGFVTFLD